MTFDDMRRARELRSLATTILIMVLEIRFAFWDVEKALEAVKEV